MTKTIVSAGFVRSVTLLFLLAGSAFAQRTLVDIIVAQNVKSELQPKLDRLATDLRNDGYTARITSWPAGKDAEDVWDHLKDGYDNHNLQGALLVGHIPMHHRDTSTVEVRNTATDGVYWSMTSYESMEPLHIWVSRFYAPSSSSHGSEAALLSNALDANHAYRTGRDRLSHKAWTYEDSQMKNSPGGGGITKARQWANNILDTWPETEAVYANRLDDVLFDKGGDFLLEHSHGHTTLYGEYNITTSKVFSRGCKIRVFVGHSCLAGAPGGVINAQNIVNGTHNVISFGYVLPVGDGGYENIADSYNRKLRACIKNGVPWGQAIVQHYSSALELFHEKGVVYGDLSLPSMMFPPEPDVPGKAGDPYPPHRADDMLTSATTLTWIPRFGTTSHDVFFGTDATPDETEFMGNQTQATFALPSLSQGTTYYWRVDEKNAHGTTEGNVWSFTTATDIRPEKADKPYPPNGAVQVRVDTDMRWNVDTATRSVDVFLQPGNASPDVRVAESLEETFFDPGTLSPNTTYSWRIDSKNVFGTNTTGDVWSFTTWDGSSPLLAYHNTDTWKQYTTNQFVGSKFTISEPISITQLVVKGQLHEGGPNIGLWAEETVVAVRTFTMTGTTFDVDDVLDVTVRLSPGTYRLAGAFTAYYSPALSDITANNELSDIEGVSSGSTLEVAYPQRTLSSSLPGVVNFRYVPGNDDVVKTAGARGRTPMTSSVSIEKGGAYLHAGDNRGKEAKIKIVDMNGRTVQTRRMKLTAGRHSLVAPNLAQGIYIITVSVGDAHRREILAAVKR